MDEGSAEKHSVPGQTGTSPVPAMDQLKTSHSQNMSNSMGDINNESFKYVAEMVQNEFVNSTENKGQTLENTDVYSYNKSTPSSSRSMYEKIMTDINTIRQLGQIYGGFGGNQFQDLFGMSASQSSEFAHSSRNLHLGHENNVKPPNEKTNDKLNIDNQVKGILGASYFGTPQDVRNWDKELDSFSSSKLHVPVPAVESTDSKTDIVTAEENKCPAVLSDVLKISEPCENLRKENVNGNFERLNEEKTSHHSKNDTNCDEDKSDKRTNSVSLEPVTDSEMHMTVKDKASEQIPVDGRKESFLPSTGSFSESHQSSYTNSEMHMTVKDKASEQIPVDGRKESFLPSTGSFSESQQSSYTNEKKFDSNTEISSDATYDEMSDGNVGEENMYEVDEEITAALNSGNQIDVKEEINESNVDIESDQGILNKGSKPTNTVTFKAPLKLKFKLERDSFVSGDEKLPAVTKLKKITKNKKKSERHSTKKPVPSKEKPVPGNNNEEEPPAHLQSMYMHIPLRNDPEDDRKPHHCPLCNRGFARASHVRRHMTIHTGEKNFKCETCGKQFTTQHYLKLHDRLHTGEKPHVCELCNRPFTHYSNYKIHLRSHTNERPYPCTVCGRSYTGSSHLKRHMRTHTGEKPHRCEVCDKMFAQPSQVRSHMYSHTGLKPFECTICGKKFIQAHVLGKHMLQHAFDAYNKEIDEKYAKERSDNPLKEETTETKRCKICNEDFSERSSLKTHMLIHMGQKPYTCTLCEKQFIELTNLKTHMLVHTGEKPYSCEVCGKEFTQQSNLKSHKRVHTGERPFNCKICGKDFAHSSSMKNHMLFHTGETRHHCPTCGKGFTDTSSLKKHVRTHTGEKPYKCKYCGRGFAASSSLKTHIFTHGGSRPYKCDSCTKQFARPSQLEKHLYERHKVSRVVESVFSKPNFDHSKDAFAKDILSKARSKLDSSMGFNTSIHVNKVMDNLNPMIERAIEAVDKKIIQGQTTIETADGTITQGQPNMSMENTGIDKSKSAEQSLGNAERGEKKMMLEQTAMPFKEEMSDTSTGETTESGEEDYEEVSDKMAVS